MKLLELLKCKPVKIKYKFLKKFFPSFVTSELFVNYLKSEGISIGRKTKFFDPKSTFVDVERPCLLHIGEYCKITKGVTILVHDYSRSVLRRKYGEILGECKETFIGDNVFIGMNSIILMGTHIGNNCIVGAGSVVSGSFQDDVVIAGNPARIICSLDDYYKKRKSKYIEEGKLWALKIYEKFKRKPNIREMGAFFPLFLKRSREELIKNNIFTDWSGDEEEEIITSFLISKPVYKSYDEFLKDSLK